MCVCIYIYDKHICVQVHGYRVEILTLRNTHAQTRIITNTNTLTHTHIYTHTHALSRTHTHTHTHTRTVMIHTYIHTCIHVYTYIHTKTYNKFVWKNKMLALGVCLWQPCSSSGSSCRVKITFALLLTNSFVFTTTKSMKCVVNWIPLRIRVRSRNTQPHLT